MTRTRDDAAARVFHHGLESVVGRRRTREFSKLHPESDRCTLAVDFSPDRYPGYVDGGEGDQPHVSRQPPIYREVPAVRGNEIGVLSIVDPHEKFVPSRPDERRDVDIESDVTTNVLACTLPPLSARLEDVPPQVTDPFEIKDVDVSVERSRRAAFWSSPR